MILIVFFCYFPSPVGSVQHSVCAREREETRCPLSRLCPEAIGQSAGIRVPRGVSADRVDGHLRCVHPAQGCWSR